MIHHFEFNQNKATQAASYLLSKSHKKMKYLKLIKLMYLLDRRALEKWNRPISGDRYFSMDHGTVISNILNLIKDNGFDPDKTYWHQFIARKRYEVELVQEPEYDELSKREIKLLDELYKKYGHLDEWELRKITHELPEWENPHGSSLLISADKLLEYLGKSQEEIAEIEEEVNSMNFLSTVFG
jgi:uncharacterized phage-associated protein